MSNGITNLFRHRVKRSKGDTSKLAARLAPLEEQKLSSVMIDQHQAIGGASQEIGAIVVDRDNLQVPKEMLDSSGGRFLGMEPVVLVILGLMLCFIAFIAWQISQMPAPE